jgi:hypothetical protein
VVVLVLLIGALTGAYLAWSRPRENPVLAGVPLRERMKGLDSTDPLTRKRTIYTLAAFGPKAKGALPKLLELLRAGDPDAAVAVGRIGTAAVPELDRLLKAKRPTNPAKQERWRSNRQAATTALGHAGPSAVASLRGLLHEGDAQLVSYARESLVRLAAEHPETIPDLAADLLSRRDFGSSPAPEELCSAAKRSPEPVRQWRSVLDQPSADAQEMATRVLGRLGIVDPRMIPSLVRMTAEWGRLDEWGEHLLQLHRRGHSVVPAVVARWRAAHTNENRLACLRFLLAVGADADELLPELRQRLRDGDGFDACQFLGAWEGRQATRAALLALGVAAGDRLAAAIAAVAQPTVIPYFINLLAEVEGVKGEPAWRRQSNAQLALAQHFARAVPFLLVALRGPAKHRNAALTFLLRRYEGNHDRARRGERPLAVPQEIVAGVAGVLRAPETRLRAIRLLGEMGPDARSAVPEILGRMDEANWESSVTAIGRIGEVSPAQDRALTRARAAFAASPGRAKVVAGLRKRLTKPQDRWEMVPALILLALHEPAEQAAPSLKGKSFFDSPLAASLAAADPFVFDHLIGIYGNHAPARVTIAEKVALAGLKSGLVLPAPLKILVEHQGDEGLIGASCRKETPTGVASALARRLADDRLEPHRAAEVLRALALMAPNGDAVKVPDALRSAKHARVRRFAAAAALRWAPKDAAARQVLLEWADVQPTGDWLEGPAYDSAAVAALAPLAPRDRAACEAILKFQEKMRNARDLGEAETALNVVLAAGKPGVDAVVARFLATGNEALAPTLQKLGAEGWVSLPAVFAEARRSGEAFQVLRPPGEGKLDQNQAIQARASYRALAAITTEETAPALLDVAAGLERALVWDGWDWFAPFLEQKANANRSLRWPSTLRQLKRWLAGPDGPRKNLAFSVLCTTHPQDSDVWKAVLKRAVDTGDGYEWVIQQAGAKGLAVIRVQLDHPDHGVQHRAAAWLRKQLSRLPDDSVDVLLADLDPRVRAAAAWAVGRRFGRAFPETDARHGAVVRRLARVLAEDADEDVRAAAWWAIDGTAARWPRTAPALLAALPPEHRTAWLREGAAMYRRERARRGHRESIRPMRSHLERWVELLDMAGYPALRPLQESLERLLPAPAALGRDALSAAALVEAFRDASYWSAVGRDGAQRRRQLRTELLRRAPAEPRVVDALVRGYLIGWFTGTTRYSNDRPVLGTTIHRLGRSALPLLLEGLEQLDQPPTSPPKHWRPREALIEMIGDLGPEAKAAVPLLLVHAGDPRYERRQAARDALRKIDPAVAAELE